MPSETDEMKKHQPAICWLAMAWAAASVGCQTMSWPAMWPFPEREQTTYRGPSMRIEAIEQLAEQADGTDAPQQREIADQLARQIQVETDPLVRATVVKTIAEFRVPISQQVLEAGLGDNDPVVRMACCRALGNRAEASSVARIAQTLRADKNYDVRMAAAEALGKIKTPESMQALVVAIDDRDPAMQYVGIQSLKAVSGKDYGGDIAAWKQLAAGGNPPTPPSPSIAERMRKVSPF
jgi:HEAT repeat protein